MQSYLKEYESTMTAGCSVTMHSKRELYGTPSIQYSKPCLTATAIELHYEREFDRDAGTKAAIRPRYGFSSAVLSRCGRVSDVL